MARVPRIELSIVGLEATLRPAPTHIWSVTKEFAPSQPLEASALQAFGLTRAQSTVIGFALIQQVPPAWLHALDRRCSIQGTRSLMKPTLQNFAGRLGTFTPLFDNRRRPVSAIVAYSSLIPSRGIPVHRLTTSDPFGRGGWYRPSASGVQTRYSSNRASPRW